MSLPFHDSKLLVFCMRVLLPGERKGRRTKCATGSGPAVLAAATAAAMAAHAAGIVAKAGVHGDTVDTGKCQRTRKAPSPPAPAHRKQRQRSGGGVAAVLASEEKEDEEEEGDACEELAAYWDRNAAAEDADDSDDDNVVASVTSFSASATAPRARVIRLAVRPEKRSLGVLWRSFVEATTVEWVHKATTRRAAFFTSISSII